jgi:hypothetical protein
MNEDGIKDMYILGHLQKCGFLGQPLLNLVAGTPLPVSDVLASLLRLQRKKFIKLKGPATLAGLQHLIACAEPISPPVFSSDSCWHSANDTVFKAADNDGADFFNTAVRVTLRGYALLLSVRKKPTTRDVFATTSRLASPHRYTESLGIK